MLSVLIVNWNTREHLMACLESIEKNPPTEDFEVIVVDNASTDSSAGFGVTGRESSVWLGRT